MPDSIDGFPDIAKSTECCIDGCNETESWVCMKCHKVLCGRYGKQHMIEHKDNDKEHCIAMGCGDLSFWCYGCDDYLDHLHIRRIFEFYKTVHVIKFGHEINNIEQLMERTDFTKQDQLEKKQMNVDQPQNDDNKEQKSAENENVEPIWFDGTEILSRKWKKKDEIEYDSDPDNKQRDGKNHQHQGIVFAVNANKGQFGKIMLKDENGGYCNYGLEAIKIKLPPATPENTVERKPVTRNTNDLYSVNRTTTSSNRTSTSTSNYSTPSYDYSRYRGYDDDDDYEAPFEYIKYDKLVFRKKEFKKGDNIEYQDEDKQIKKGKIVDMDNKKNLFKVKLSSGDTVEVNIEKIRIGVNKRFWCCAYCGFENGIKTKECMVCTMNDVEIEEKSKRPEGDQKDDKKGKGKTKTESKDNDDDNDSEMKDKKEEEMPQRFFVYGTLRDDDDSEAPWTAGWVDGCKAGNAKLYGFKMYHDKHGKYPFAVKTGDNKDFIVGRMITFDGETFQSKLSRADEIEGYRGSDSDLYHREIVEIENIDDNNKKLKAVFYFKDAPKDLKTAYDEVPNGDWLQRQTK
eukprot:CAMPEP_0201595522 /NCGR_PEP_ID=MMETSP0190_2-20130828/192500_1 /ASSEMBLY_ACC=CAM_ASM_000263 /TAXON_ID=37353 /ORGANISM="Rosalina sp." /LENGTH=568 /DNA_ID=CAMNT_0048055543 /DNA_START=24 /DNA_END=1730 /DNA_ORIENTATION=-